MTNEQRPFDRIDYAFKVLVIFALTITAIILARDIIIPMAFAGFLSVLMLPMIIKLEERKISPGDFHYNCPARHADNVNAYRLAYHQPDYRTG